MAAWRSRGSTAAPTPLEIQSYERAEFNNDTGWESAARWIWRMARGCRHAASRLSSRERCGDWGSEECRSGTVGLSVDRPSQASRDGDKYLLLISLVTE
jgi:hypothetical protein